MYDDDSADGLDEMQRWLRERTDRIEREGGAS